MVLEELRVQKIELETQNQKLIETQEKLADAHNRYLELYDFAPIGYMSLDTAGIVREANRTAASFLGTPRNQLLGTPFSHYVLEWDHPLLASHIRKSGGSGRKTTTEIRLVSENGIAMQVELCTMPLINEIAGQVLFQTTIIDITRHKNAEAQLLLLSRSRADSASKVTQEFRSPLNCIQEGIASVMRGSYGAVNADQLDALAMVKGNADRLDRLINHVTKKKWDGPERRRKKRDNHG